MRKYEACTLFLALLFCVALGIGGCSSGGEKPAVEGKPVIAPGPVSEGAAVPPAAAPSAPEAPAAPVSAAPKGKAGGDGTVAVEVDAARLTFKALDKEVEQKMALLKEQIPPNSLEQARAEIRKGIIDDFVMRTLLQKEVVRQKMTASEQEVGEILKAMKANLPPGVTMEELLKRNNIDAAKMREEITMNIQINKLVLAELGGKVTVSDKEIADFYQKNRDKFTKPETVRARHLLIALAAGDSDKIKAEKKAKAEELRKELVAGADFAALAKKHSDCPSKEKGGDLGSFTRGQMVPPFEEAVFSQKKNEIGPVVATEFGFHIIQVLDREAAQVMALDGEAKKKITPFLEQQKQQVAFEGLVKRIKAKANIVVYGREAASR